MEVIEKLIWGLSLSELKKKLFLELQLRQLQVDLLAWKEN